MYTLKGVQAAAEGGLALGLLRRPNTGNNCSGREDKLMTKTLKNMVLLKVLIGMHVTIGNSINKSGLE